MNPQPVTFDCFTETWETVKKDLATFAVGILIFIVVNFLLSLPFTIVNQLQLMDIRGSGVPTDEASMRQISSPLYWLMILGSTLMGAFAYPLLVGLTRVALRKMRGELGAGIGQMFELQGAYWRLVGLGLFWVVGFSIGLALCVVPGLVWYALTLPAGLIVVEQNKSAMEALSMSFSAMQNYIGVGMLICVAGLALAIAGVCLCGIGMLFLGPPLYVAGAAVYRRLFPEPVSFGNPGDYYRPPTTY
jgi:uncharacterized membrane protein